MQEKNLENMLLKIFCEKIKVIVYVIQNEILYYRKNSLKSDIKIFSSL